MQGSALMTSGHDSGQQVMFANFERPMVTWETAEAVALMVALECSP